MKPFTTAAALAVLALAASPAQASNWWNDWWGNWNWGSGGGWNGWNGWHDEDDDLDGDYCDDDDHHGWGHGGWDDGCDVTPPAPTGVPEIDGDLLGAGLLLLVGGGLVLSSRSRLG